MVSRMSIDCNHIVCFLCRELFHRSFEHTNITLQLRNHLDHLILVRIRFNDGGLRIWFRDLPELLMFPWQLFEVELLWMLKDFNHTLPIDTIQFRKRSFPRSHKLSLHFCSCSFSSHMKNLLNLFVSSAESKGPACHIHLFHVPFLSDFGYCIGIADNNQLARLWLHLGRTLCRRLLLVFYFAFDSCAILVLHLAQTSCL